MADLQVFLVHGTQFYLSKKPEIPWVAGPRDGNNEPTEPGRRFQPEMRRLLQDLGHTVVFTPIPWSGRNRHSARLEAARKILSTVVPPRPHDANQTSPPAEPNRLKFLVAHSHGGNAALLALKQSAELRERFCGIACLSTPFIVVQKAECALLATIAWTLVVLLEGIWVISSQLSLLSSVLISFLYLTLIVQPLLHTLRRFKSLADWTQAPDC